MLAKEQRRLMAELLEGVANGKISIEKALEETKGWPAAIWTDRLLADAWHVLKHFGIDQDVSSKDRKFAAFQRELLVERASRLRESV